jgi:hypothetical protein
MLPSHSHYAHPANPTCSKILIVYYVSITIHKIGPFTQFPYLHITAHTTLTTLALRSEPYDPYLPRGGSSANPSGEPGRPQGNTKTAAIQQQIDDTVGIMRENITRVAERGERLDVLQDKTGEFYCSSFAVRGRYLFGRCDGMCGEVLVPGGTCGSQGAETTGPNGVL